MFHAEEGVIGHAFATFMKEDKTGKIETIGTFGMNTAGLEDLNHDIGYTFYVEVNDNEWERCYNTLTEWSKKKAWIPFMQDCVAFMKALINNLNSISKPGLLYVMPGDYIEQLKRLNPQINSDGQVSISKAIIDNQNNSKSSKFQFQYGEDFDKLGFFTFENRLIQNPSYQLRIALQNGATCKTVREKGRYGEEISYEYDNSGLLLKMISSNKLPNNQINKFSQVYKYLKDEKGQIVEINKTSILNTGKIDEIEVVYFKYDNLGRVIYTKNKETEETVDYNADGKISFWSASFYTGTPTSRTEKYTYNTNGDLTEIIGSGFIKFNCEMTYESFVDVDFTVKNILLKKIDIVEQGNQSKPVTKFENYRTVVDKQGKLIEYDQKEIFYNKCIYHNNRIDSVFRIQLSPKLTGSISSLKVYKYLPNGYVDRDLEYEVTSFTNEKNFKLGKLLYGKKYDYKTGIKTIQNNYSGEIEISSFKCF